MEAGRYRLPAFNPGGVTSQSKPPDPFGNPQRCALPMLALDMQRTGPQFMLWRHNNP